ncbi:MAG: type II toxin-antitoxin system PemK/MazF family toxin [Phaeodactylibacter sp.]|nr:type II toxin-antitoxin system PemK/MazF family toxin [Phaeodactylibacter sp.]
MTKESSADCFQVRSVSQKRLVRKIGELNQTKMTEIEIALSKVLKINL